MTNNHASGHSHYDENEPVDAGLVIRPIYADTLDEYIQHLFGETSCDYDFDDGDVHAKIVNAPDDDEAAFDVLPVDYPLREGLRDRGS
jgi:hypothetical protein